MIGIAVHILGMALVVFTHNLKIALASILLMGFAMGARCFVGYAFTTEHMKTIDSGKVTSATFFFDSMGIFVASIYFKFISKDWRYLWGTAMVSLIIPLVGISKQIESPKFLHSVGKFDKAREALTIIGRTNGKLTSKERFSKLFK